MIKSAEALIGLFCDCQRAEFFVSHLDHLQCLGLLAVPEAFATFATLLEEWQGTPDELYEVAVLLLDDPKQNISGHEVVSMGALDFEDLLAASVAVSQFLEARVCVLQGAPVEWVRSWLTRLG